VTRREGFIRKARNGRFYAEVERSVDPITGKRRRLALGGFDTKDEAAQAIHKAIDRRRRGLGDPGRVTVGEYLEEWLSGVELELSPTTAALYRTIVRNYVVPRIGTERLRSVTPAMLTRFYGDLSTGGGHGGRKLKPRTVRNVHRTIRTALEGAVDARLLDWNPAASKATKVPRVVSAERDVWTPAQLARFLEVASTDRLAALWILAASTGMRRAELVGLRWRDVDLDTGVLRVRRTIVQYGSVIVEKEPKTPRSRRTYNALDPRAMAALRAHRAAQAAERLAAGSAWTDGTDRIFRDELGRDLRPDAVTRGMARLVKRAGLPKLSPHGLRHTFATVGLESGVDVVYVSELLGHSSPTTTAAIYQHSRPERLAAAGRQIADALLGAISSQR
jgi:integrase